MRLLVFNCLLLASVAVALPNGRQKRNLSDLKNLIISAIFGQSQINIQPEPVLQEDNGYKLFRLPGYDDVIIRVAAKKPVVEEFVFPPVVEKVNINASGTVVGTKSNDDILVAVKEIDNLLSTGILYGGHNNVMEETFVPMLSSINTANYVVEEKIKTAPVIETRPVVTEVIENIPDFTEVIENTPVISEVIIPLEEKVELKVPFEPTYSHKKNLSNEPMMTYIAQNNPGVEELETIKMKTALPKCIKKRVYEAIVLGADPNRLAPVQKVFQYQSTPVVDFSYPRVDTNWYVHNYFREEVAPVQEEVFQYQSPVALEFSYPRKEHNSYVQNSSREDALTKGFGSDVDFGSQTLKPLKDSPEHYNLRPTKTKLKDKINSQARKVQAFNNLGEKVDISQTLGPIPPQYITNVGKKGGNSVVSNENMKQMKALSIVGSKDNVSNAKIPINVYRLQSNPNTGKVGKENSVAPAVNNEATKKDTVQVKNVVYTNKVTAKPQSVTRPVVVPSTNEPKEKSLTEYIQKFIIHKPTVVKDAKKYSYHQKHADGSSMNVIGNKQGVSVSVKENNNRGRGDIPDQK